MSHAEVAKKRMEIIENSINKAKSQGKTISLKKLIAQSCIEWGSTPKTIKAYVNNLRDSGKVQLTDEEMKS